MMIRAKRAFFRSFFGKQEKILVKNEKIRFFHTLSEARLLALVGVIHRSTKRKLLLEKEDLKK